MRNSIWLMGVALAMLTAPTTLKAADITYTFDESVFGGLVTGTITTDGNTGALTSGDIVDWNLVISDGTDPSFDLLGPLSGNNSTMYFLNSGDLTASLTQLSYDFGDPSGGTLDFLAVRNGPVLCYQAASTFCGYPPLCNHCVELDTLDPETYFQGLGPSTDVIASVAAPAVPEPGTISLMLIGLGLPGLAAVMRKRSPRGDQQPAERN